jgi:nucleotide-binding universal stress UspA family protein
MPDSPDSPGRAAAPARGDEAEYTLPARALLATDGSPEAGHAARAAAKLCSGAGSELHLVHVQSHLYARSEAITEQAIEALEHDARRLLEEQAALVASEGGTVAQCHLGTGHPDDHILKLAEQLDAGLVIVGSRGLGRLKRMLLGSVADGVAHRCRRPVLVVRGRLASWPPDRIILADDGSQAAWSAARLAAAIGGLSGAKVTLVRAYPELPRADQAERLLDARIVDDELRRQQHLLEERARNLEGLLGARPRIRIAVGDAAEVVVDAAEVAEAAESETIMDAGGSEERDHMSTLIAVGSRSLGPVDRLRLGSVSSRVLSVARGPVLICPVPDEVTNRELTEDGEMRHRT